MDQHPQNRDVIARPVVPAQRVTPAPKQRKSKKVWWIATIIVVVALAALGFVGRYFWMGGSQVDSSKYQAVFLSNGQVYFGKLHAYYTEHPYLTDVYYIQANSTDTTKTSADTNGNQQLIKLGGEIHAPEDEMILNKQSILFVENLTSGSKVVKLIQDGNKK